MLTVDSFRRRKGKPPGGGQEFDRVPNIPGVTDLVVIAKGTAATVYRGEEPAMHRKVAAKAMRYRLGDQAGRQAFNDECARAGEVGEHPCAATLYRNGFDGDQPYIVMQYYAGGSLASKLKARYEFSVAEVLTAGVRIASALQFAHDLGILHRDVKPENILSDAFGDTVLADFGIAIDRDGPERDLRRRMTPAFAAPEVLQRGGGWPVSDVWSLAATLYALLAGRPPFYDPAQPDEAANQWALAGPLPALGRPDVPPHVTDTLTRALIGEPDRRTVSARRFHDELREDLSKLGLAPPPVSLAPPPASGSASAPGPASAPQPASVPAPAQPPFQAPARPPATPATPATPAPAPTPAYLSSDTGFLPTGEAFRVVKPAAGDLVRPKKTGRPGRTMLLATGVGVLAIAVGLAAFALIEHRQQARTTANSSPAPSKASAPSTAAVPPPPTNVTVVPVRGSAVQISWRDTAPPGRYRQVVISLGAGNKSYVVADRSPQVISGLDPAKPYCFAVGYVYNLSGAASYSAPPACIRGGVPGTG